MRNSLTCWLAFLLLLGTAYCGESITEQQSWIYGILVGIGISGIGFIASIFLVCIQTLITPEFFMTLVNMLYSLGCGAIIGDAIIHILPDAFKDPQTNSQIVSFVFICAVVFFLILERLFEVLGVAHHHWGEDQHDHHGHQHQPSNCLQEDKQHQNKQKSKAQQPTKHSHDNEIAEEGCFQSLRGKQTAGYLNLLSSFIHNFFDGFAIGVAFGTRDSTIYMPVVIAIIAHEIPREMGDVGILIKSGFTSYQTVMWNGVINFMSLAGVIPGLAIGGMKDSYKNYVMVFVAGNFIYIGADIWRNLLKNKYWCHNVMELVMFFLGVATMFLVLVLEDGKE